MEVKVIKVPARTCVCVCVCVCVCFVCACALHLPCFFTYPLELSESEWSTEACRVAVEELMPLTEKMLIFGRLLEKCGFPRDNRSGCP